MLRHSDTLYETINNKPVGLLVRKKNHGSITLYSTFFLVVYVYFVLF